MVCLLYAPLKKASVDGSAFLYPTRPRYHRLNLSSLIFFFLLMVLAAQPVFAQATDPGWSKKVGARKMPSGKKIFWVNNYKAISDGSASATKAIQQAIDACAKNGGGQVCFKPGTYLSGSIFLKSNVHLRIDKGVLIKGSQDFNDYPEIDTRIAGIEMKWPAALINVIGQKNVQVSGEGKVDAQGKFCWDKYWSMRKEYEPKGLRWIVDYDAKRVRTFLVQSSSDVTLKGLTFSNAGFWTVQLLYSDHITVDGVTVRNNEDGKGPSTDGIDIDSSSWVLVENCDIDGNDDDFCLKSGRDWDGLRVNRPTEYVVIRNCMARKGGGLLTLGSETSGGIRHVLATDLKAKGTGNGFHIKSATTRGGIVEDITFRNIEMDSVGNAFMYTMNWNPSYSYSKLPEGYTYETLPAHWKVMLHKVEPPEKGIPHFKDIHVSNVVVKHARKAINGSGLEQSLLENFHFSDVDINADNAGEVSYARGWEWKRVTIRSKDSSTVRINNSNGLIL
jgi:polygalacturonase